MVDFITLKGGYAFCENPVDLVILSLIRSIVGFYATKSSKWSMQKGFIVFQLVEYVFTMVKLLALSDVPIQMSYLGLYIIIFWSLISIILHGVIIKRIRTHTVLNKNYEELNAEEANNNREDSSEKYEENDRLSTSVLLRFIVGYIYKHALWYGVGLVCALSYAAVRVFIPLTAGHVIVDITTTKTFHSVLQSVTIMASIATASAIFGGFRCGIFVYATDRLANNVKSDLFSAIMKQEIGFFDKNGTGELLSRITSDCERMSSNICWNMNMFLRNIVIMFGSIIVMFSMSWRLTMISIIIIPVNTVIVYHFGALFDKLSEQRQKATSLTNKIAEEALSSVRTVRSFACEDQESRRFDEKLGDVLQICKKKAIGAIGFNMSSEICDNFMSTCVLFYGGYLVVTGRSWIYAYRPASSDMLPTQYLITFFLYQTQLRDNIYGMGDIFSGLMQSLGASRKIFRYITRTAEIANDGINKPEVRGTITLTNVHFNYPTRPNQPILSGLSVEFICGERVALVVASGGGKSSIVSLIEHFYEPQEGSITLDGILIRDIAHDYYHQKIALVAQEPVLYDGSIRYNITYGCEWATEEDMLRAATMANVHSFVLEMDQGYDTKCGEKGVQMSGGQKQRIAIARALVRNPAVLILDEATSALDAESESQVQDAINKCTIGRTVIIIAHRLSTIEKSDRILVIEKGKLIQTGNHEQLMKDLNGIYYKLVSKQLLSDTTV